MTKKFCPKCGKTETSQNPLLEEFCQNCTSKETPLLKKYKPLKIVLCPSCKSYLYQNKWHPSLVSEDEANLKEIITKLLPEKLVFIPDAKIKSISIQPNFLKTLRKKSGKIDVDVEIKGTINGIESLNPHTLPINLEYSLCNLCKKQSSSYFEATLQLRPKDERLLIFVQRDIEESEKVAITNFEKKKFGYNLNITAKEYIRNILPKVKSKFDVETKISKTLFGRKDGKDIYRITLLIRLKE